MDQSTRVDPGRLPPFGVILRLATNVSRAPQSVLLRSRLRRAILSHVMYRDASEFPFRLYAATGDAVAQLDSLNGETVDVSLNLEGRGVMCLAVDPHDPQRIFAGTFD